MSNLKSMNVLIITGSTRSNRLNSEEKSFIPIRSAARLLMAGLFCIFALTPLVAQKSIDCIFLLDTSESMFRQNGNQAELLVSEVMKNRLDFQDRFHLLSFAGEPELELQQVLTDRESVQEVLGRVMMIQPVEKDTDIISGLRFLTDYMTELPLHTEKLVYIVSDDVHDPSNGSAYTDRDENENRIVAISDFIRRNGWKVQILLYPEQQATAVSGSGTVQKGLLSKLAGLLDVEPFEYTGDNLTALFPDAAVKQDALDTAASQTADATEKSAVEEGKTSIDEDGEEGSTSRKVGATDDSGRLLDLPGLWWLIVLFIVVFILLFILIRRIFSTAGGERLSAVDRSESTDYGLRKSDGKSRTTFVQPKSDSFSVLKDAKKDRSGERETPYGTEHRKEQKREMPAPRKKDSDSASVLSAFAARDRSERDGVSIRLGTGDKKSTSRVADTRYMGREGQTAIEMRVDFQRNTFRKNTQWFDDGSSFSVGQQGTADFEITSIDISGVIATIRRKKDFYVFTSDQPEYFPDLNQDMKDCLNRNIRIVSPDTGFATTIRFHQWLSPLERLNRMLHVIDKPGKPDPDLE